MHRGRYSRRCLPHRNSFHAITLRLADSLPSRVIQRWKAELQKQLDSSSLGARSTSEIAPLKRIRGGNYCYRAVSDIYQNPVQGEMLGLLEYRRRLGS